jgi:hypothetical protein
MTPRPSDKCVLGAWIATVLMMAVMSTFLFDQFEATFHGNFKTFLPTFVTGIGATWLGWLWSASQ